MHSILDLGATPPCERFLAPWELSEPEPTYPLHMWLCRECMLAQVPALIDPHETFTEYAYYASYSDSWVAHARDYLDVAIARAGLGPDSFVVEVASNDGYLLQHAVARRIRCLGVEPSVNVGSAAREKGVPTVTAFLTEETGRSLRAEHGPASLVVANNVYAHVPDIVDFTKGLRALLDDHGWLSVEVAHLASLIENNQYDTIYHEHFQYYTVASLRRALASGGLELVDVELLPSHGGSIRAWARPRAAAGRPSRDVERVLAGEAAAGLHDLGAYSGFAQRVCSARQELLRFLLDAAAAGKLVVGYGAPGKGNTLLNYCGIRTDLLPYTVDRNPYKHGRFTPGVRIPVLPPERIERDRPDYVLVLPWNLRAELTEALRYVGGWGGRLVFPIPHVEVVPLPAGAHATV